MQIIKNAWDLGKDFFIKSEYKKKAIALFITSIILELVMVYFNVILNEWNNDFYTSLQEYNKDGIYKALGTFFIIVFFYILVFVSKYVFQSILTIEWRKWMTQDYINKWTNNDAYYGTNNLFRAKNDNPDQRISEDISYFIDYTLSLTLGLLNSIVSLISFVTILWTLSGVLKFTLLDTNFAIKGYLVWLSVIYAGIGTVVAYRIGRDLPLIDYLQEQKEASFRFRMMRFRENSENIAFYKGVLFEKGVFKLAIDKIVDNFYIYMHINKRLSIWTNLYNNMTTVVPILAACPRYFKKEITLGKVMQIYGAFREVHTALSFLVNSFRSIAAYKAVIIRLTEFNANIENWHQTSQTKAIAITNEGDQLSLNNLNIQTPFGKSLIINLNVTFKHSESYIITGKNGAGKSTLLRAIRGLWPFGSGEINIPSDKNIFYIPQRTYMPFGTLAEVIFYPKTCLTENDKDYIKSLMKTARIDYLSDRLDEEENWGIILSLGEQQKIALIRAILSLPDILIMDESTNALNEEDEEIFFKLLKEKLPKATIITIGHKSALKQYFNNEVKV
ncbi:MAG: ABC transporter ATP-binding protein/permease [Sphingobacteriia bacterium]|nr:ABC transporter ATP-binding protein/permease [Sphingobacteriia bacterium]